jgi:hypothetical protein
LYQGYRLHGINSVGHIVLIFTKLKGILQAKAVVEK